MDNITSLQVSDTKVGTGAAATAGMQVTVHYTGWLYDAKAADKHGKKFDSSKDHGEPFSFKLGARRDMKALEPGKENVAEPSRQPVLLAEIDHMQATARHEERRGAIERARPRRDHRQAVGEENAIERRSSEQPLRIEIGRVTLAEKDSFAEAGAVDTDARGLEHAAGYVDTVANGVGIEPRRDDQIARRAATDLEHVATGRRLQRGDQPIAAEQEIPPAEVIDVALAPIDAVHHGAVGGGHPRNS